MYYSEKPEERHRNGWNTDHPDEKWRFRDLATAVLPTLRRAQAEAWDEGQMSADRDWATGGHARLNPYRYQVEEDTDG